MTLVRFYITLLLLRPYDGSRMTGTANNTKSGAGGLKCIHGTGGSGADTGIEVGVDQGPFNVYGGKGGRLSLFFFSLFPLTFEFIS